MHKFIKMFYENKFNVLKVIGIVVFILIIIQLANSMYKAQDLKKYEEYQNSIGSSNSTTIDNSDYLINQSQTVKKSNDKAVKNTMEEFVGYCNNKNLEEAYEILTEDCKEKLYPTIEDFEQNYISKVFEEQKSYTMQAWEKEDNKLVYVINYTGDILATGKQGNNIQEYYTFVEQEDGSYKLNINNYIYSENYRNLQTTQDDITVRILSKDVYKEYAIYEFQVFNNTENTILLNGDKSRKKLYLLDDDKVTYSSLQSDFDKNEEIVLRPVNDRKFRVRFNKVYNTNVIVKKLVFNDIILNYDEYVESLENNEDIENEEEANEVINRIKLSADLLQ